MTAPKQAADRADEIALKTATEIVAELKDILAAWVEFYGHEEWIASRIASAIRSAEPQWRYDMENAPKDGTRILIWFVHDLAKFSRNPVADGYAAAHEACWIDHNGGGWTWHGLAGVATAWRPLPVPPEAISASDQPGEPG